MRRGKSLKKGDTIGIVAPASHTKTEKLIGAKENLEKMGYNVVLGRHTGEKWFSYAGTDRERANDINEFFSDPKIDAIICMRGGYGSNRLIQYIDFEKIKNNPKIFVGYSDITTLHMAINERCDLVTYHGPMAVSNFFGEYNEDTYKHFVDVLSDTSKKLELQNFTKKLGILNEGYAKGQLVGGNLTTLIASLGSEYDLDYSGKILFLEDVGEKTYKIDRYLNMLKKQGVLEKISGIILGDFKNCEKDSEEDMGLLEVFCDYFKELNIPVVTNLETGHCEPMLTLPLGAMCELDTEKESITIY